MMEYVDGQISIALQKFYYDFFHIQTADYTMKCLRFYT